MQKVLHTKPHSFYFKLSHPLWKFQFICTDVLLLPLLVMDLKGYKCF